MLFLEERDNFYWPDDILMKVNRQISLSFDTLANSNIYGFFTLRTNRQYLIGWSQFHNFPALNTFVFSNPRFFSCIYHKKSPFFHQIYFLGEQQSYKKMNQIPSFCVGKERKYFFHNLLLFFYPMKCKKLTVVIIIFPKRLGCWFRFPLVSTVICYFR